MTYDLIDIAWKSVITSGLALLLLAVLKNRSAAERSWVAHAGLVATLLLPLAVFAIPRWQVEAPASVPDVMVWKEAAPVAAAPDRAVPAVTSSEAAIPAQLRSTDTAAPAFTLDLETLASWLYGIPAALLLLVTLAAVFRLFALRGRATVLVEQNWLSALAHAQRRMGFKHGTALLVSNELTSPVSWGILRPIILLNEEAVNSASEAEAIIAHELAHVARLDWAKLLIARAATALFWFNPLVWMLARQCHQLREEAADDAVLRSDVVSTDYAALLVGAARHESKGLLLAANGVAPGRGSLKRRVTRVLDTNVARAPARIAWTSACSVGAILISAPLSALTPVNPVQASVTDFVAAQGPAGSLRAIASDGASLVISRDGVSIASAPPAPLPAADAVPAAVKVAVNDVAIPAAINAALNAASSASAVASASMTASAGAIAATTASAAAHPVERLANGRLSPDMLIKMKVHGVTPEYISALIAADPSFASLSIDELVAMRIHGVSPEKVREYSRLGYRGLTRKQIMNMSIHGVSPGYIGEMAKAGYPRLSPDQLVKMRIHGVSPAYVREFKAAGYDDLTADELVKMRIHGVRMDAGNRADKAHPDDDED